MKTLKGDDPMKIELSKQASKVITKLDKPTKQRIKKALQKIPDGDIVVLQGSTSSFRLRVGSWRIIFSYVTIDDEKAILVEKIDSRGGVYKGA